MNRKTIAKKAEFSGNDESISLSIIITNHRQTKQRKNIRRALLLNLTWHLKILNHGGEWIMDFITHPSLPMKLESNQLILRNKLSWYSCSLPIPVFHQNLRTLCDFIQFVDTTSCLEKTLYSHYEIDAK